MSAAEPARMSHKPSIPALVDDATLAAVSGGASPSSDPSDVRGFAKWFRSAGRALGDQADRVLPEKSGPYTGFNNRGYDWGRAGEHVGRGVNAALGMSSGVSSDISAWDAHSGPGKPL